MYEGTKKIIIANKRNILIIISWYLVLKFLELFFDIFNFVEHEYSILQESIFILNENKKK